MQSRRDLYQAHRLMMQRVGLALLQGEPDVAESPMRRTTVGALAGGLLALVIVGVFGIWGILSPGGAKGIDQGGTLIIEKETGTKYVFDTGSRKLLPVANYASALLALNTKDVKRRTVSHKSLMKYERGPMIGIVGAPDSLPAAGQLIRGPWSVCVREAEGANGVRRSMTALMAGREVGGRTLGANQALVVQASGQGWVIWKDRRMNLGLPPAQVAALTGGAQPAQVAGAWLNAIPAAGDFAAPQIPGQRGRAVAGPGNQPGRVGQVFQANTGNGARNHYVLLQDGLAPISETQARLLLSDPATKAAYPGRLAEALPTDLPSATALQSRTRLFSDQIPPTMPRFVSWTPTEPLCAVYSGNGAAGARLTLGGSLPAPSATALGAGTAGGASVDQLVLPPGGASLVRLASGGGGQTSAGAVGSLAIINDQGMRFAIPSAEIAANLGYDAAKAAPVPASVLHLIPQGPALDPRAAATPVRMGG